MSDQVLTSTSIHLDNKEYLLLRRQDAGMIGSRSWQVITRPLPLPRFPRQDIQESEIPGEYIQVLDDWSEGICGEREGLIGGIYFTEMAHGMLGGSLMPVVPNESQVHTDNEGAEIIPAAAVVFNNELFVAHGRYVYKYAGGAKTQDKDFGSGKICTDLIVHNNALLAAMGESEKIYSRATDGTWTQASDNTFAVHFALVEDRLWRAVATNEVSNIGPTDSPLTLANWSTGITIGDDDYAITDLNGYGERVAVSKVDGLYLGDSQALFPNVLPMIAPTPDPENGRHTLVKGSDIYYPHVNGIIRYRIGGAEELGLPSFFTSATLSDNIPGTRVTTMCLEGLNIWAATEPALYPRARPTGVQKTTDNGSSYTNLTANLIDSNMSTISDIDSLDTAANGDWVIVGYSAPFYGVILDITKPNANASIVTVEYWNGSAWTAVPVGASILDRTTKSLLSTPQTAGTKSLSRSGAITWSDTSLGAWATSTINSVEAYWIRLSWSAALDSEVEIAEAWVLTSAPRSYIFRGRPGQDGDRRSSTVVWEPFSYVQGMSFPGAILVTADQFPHNRREQLLVAGRQTDVFNRLPVSPIEMPAGQNSGGGKVYTPKLDGGTPLTLKQYLSVTIKGVNIDSDRDLNVYYRVDDDTSWTQGQLLITSSPTTISLSGVSGRSIQLRLEFNAFSGATVVAWPQITEVSIRYRERPDVLQDITMTLLVGDRTHNAQGGELPAGKTQLTNLEALVNAAPVTLIGPLRDSRTVMVHSITQVEALQEGFEYPAVAVELRCSEVS